MKTMINGSNVNHVLPKLAREVLSHGDEVGSRLGERTMELLHVGIALHQPWQREIVLPGRKASIAAQVAETMWVLSGRNDVDWLSHYLPRAGDFSDDGSTWRSGYGPRLRDFHGVDQLDRVVELLRRSPGTRQAVINIWDPTVDGTPGKDTACNNWLSFISRKGTLDLHVAIRSNDLIWGWSGINQFEWSALQEVVAGLTGLMVGELHFTVASLHVYDRHWAKARELGEGSGLVYTGEDSPRFDAGELPDRRLSFVDFDQLMQEWFGAEGLIRTGQPVDVDAFPEPMLRSWLRVLQWYWSGDETFLAPLRGTRLHHAAMLGSKPAGKPQPAHMRHVHRALDDHLPMSAPERPSFLTFVTELHAEKHAAYGDSWKRRGEAGILSNIGRKADRLDTGAETADETQLDTAIDLLVYLAKYRCWLDGGLGDPREVDVILGEYEKGYDGERSADLEFLQSGVDQLFTSGLITEQKLWLVDGLLADAYLLARSRY